MPVRVQLSRAKGWRMPPNTVSVARPGRFGNPFKPAAYYEAGLSGTLDVALKHCVDAHAAWMSRKRHWAFTECFVLAHPVPDISCLRGKNLACWCPLEAYCHADILLELANAYDGDGGA